MSIQQEGEEEKHGQNGKAVTILAKSGTLVKDLVHSLVFCCTVKSLKVEIESKNCISKCIYGENTNTIYSNPYIQL